MSSATKGPHPHAGRFKLFCWIIGVSESLFHVDIAASIETVSDLKEAILDKIRNTRVWTRINSNSGRQVVSLKFQLELHPGSYCIGLYDRNSLQALELLSSTFSDASQGYIHIIVKARRLVSIQSSLPCLSSAHVTPRLLFVNDVYDLSLLILQIRALLRNLAWAVLSRRLLCMSLPSGIFFGTPFGGSQLLDVLLKPLPVFPIRGRWKRQLRERTTSISNSPRITTFSRVICTEYLPPKLTSPFTQSCAKRINSTAKWHR